MVAKAALKVAGIGPVGSEQAEHDPVADALVEAFRAQADQLRENPPNGGQPGAPPPEEMAQRLGSAADEVSAGASAMRSAIGAFTQSPLEIDDGIGYQQTALEHLVAAINILEPPEPPEPQENEENQEEEMSDEQVERKLEEARERERDRRREQERRRQPNTEPVEKDW